MKHLGCQILGFFAARYSTRYETVDTLEIALIELRKARGIALRRFDQQLLVYPVLHRSHKTLREGRLIY